MIDTTIYTKDEKSLLVFLETALVDSGGLVIGERMNKDDFDKAEEWEKQGFIQFGRIASKDIDSYGVNIKTHWVVFTQNSWQVAHQLRIERANRMIASVTRNRLGYVAHA